MIELPSALISLSILLHLRRKDRVICHSSAIGHNQSRQSGDQSRSGLAQRTKGKPRSSSDDDAWEAQGSWKGLGDGGHPIDVEGSVQKWDGRAVRKWHRWHRCWSRKRYSPGRWEQGHGYERWWQAWPEPCHHEGGWNQGGQTLGWPSHSCNFRWYGNASEAWSLDCTARQQSWFLTWLSWGPDKITNTRTLRVCLGIRLRHDHLQAGVFPVSSAGWVPMLEHWKVAWQACLLPAGPTRDLSSHALSLAQLQWRTENKINRSKYL